MRIIRPIEAVTCCVCGEAFDKLKMREIFTGRVKYICPECYAAANKQLDSRRAAWKDSAKDRQILSEMEKRK